MCCPFTFAVIVCPVTFAVMCCPYTVSPVSVNTVSIAIVPNASASTVASAGNFSALVPSACTLTVTDALLVKLYVFVGLANFSHRLAILILPCFVVEPAVNLMLPCNCSP